MPSAPTYQIEVQAGPVYDVTVTSTETSYTVEVATGPTYQVEMQLGIGPAGTAATIQSISATTVPYGTPASATNTGTPTAAVIEISVPAGKDGTGDVNGPAGAVDSHVAVFDGTGGKLLKDGGAMPVPPSPATATPAPLGTAAVGTSSKYAREDHVHPLPAAVTSYAQAFLLGGM